MYTKDDLKTMQAWPLQRKIQVTQTRILEYGLKLNGKICVSFSGGKDSTVLLDLVRRVFPDCPAVFIDTGLEYPEIREFVKTIPNVTWVKPKMNFRKVIETYGYPLVSKEVAQKIYEYRKNPDGYTKNRFESDSDYVQRYGQRYCLEKWVPLRDSGIPVSHMCCNIMKKAPSKEYEKTTGRHMIVATMACESNLRKTDWLRNGCNSFDGKIISKPMSFWTEQDVLAYIKLYDLKYASVYGDIEMDEKGKYYTTGADRTGCIFCGFGAQSEKQPNRFQRLKSNHPQLWDYCMRSWDEGGLGMKEVLGFIGVPIELENNDCTNGQLKIYDYIKQEEK